MLSLNCAWINDWVNNREAGDLRRHCTHFDVTVMLTLCALGSVSICNKTSYCKICKASKPWDLYLKVCDLSEIWQAHRQQCCRCHCSISTDLNSQSRCFETSQDLTITRLVVYWNGALGTTVTVVTTAAMTDLKPRSHCADYSLPMFPNIVDHPDLSWSWQNHQIVAVTPNLCVSKTAGTILVRQHWYDGCVWSALCTFSH